MSLKLALKICLPIAVFTTYSIFYTNNIVLSKTENVIKLNNDSLYPSKKIIKDAYRALGEQNYQRAVFLFEKYLNRNDDDNVRYNYAYSLMQINNIEKAKIQLQIIINGSNDKTLKNKTIELLETLKTKKNSKQLIVKINKSNLIQIVDLYKYTDHYLCNEADQTINKDGTFEVLENITKPLNVYIPEIPSELNVSNKGSYIEILKKSFLKWEIKSKNFVQFEFISNKKQADIVVNWLDQLKNTNKWGLSSLPKYFDDLNKKVSILNIPIRTQPHTAKFTDEVVNFSLNELQGLITHEIGHALGLKHSFDDNSNQDIMNPRTHNFSVSNNFMWDVSERDITSLKRLYSLPNNSKVRCKEGQIFEASKPKVALNVDKNKIFDLRNDKSDNYLCFSPGDLELLSDGVSYIRNYTRWKKTDFPLKVYLPKPNGIEFDIENPNNYYNLVKNAFKKWTERDPKLISFEFVEAENQAKIIITWRDYFKHEPYWGAAISFPNKENKNIKDKCIINLAVRAQPGWYSEVPIIFSNNDFENIAVHEIGHALGLDHGPDVNGATGKGSLITDRDINTLEKLYSIPLDNDILCSIK